MRSIYKIPLRRPEAITPMEAARPDTFLTAVPEAEIHLFPADAAVNTGIAALICPGGGYLGLALGSEGHLCAAYLADRGITALVLQYRLPAQNPALPLEDASEAMVLARSLAPAWGFSPDKLGILGFSAGGHLAAMTSTIFTCTPQNSRPDFSVLVYPVISLEKRKRGITRRQLLGKTPTDDAVRAHSCHLLVGPETPPALLLHCDDDERVPAGQSLLYYAALKEHAIPASLHIFPQGGHAWGFWKNGGTGAAFRHIDTAHVLLAEWILGQFQG